MRYDYLTLEDLLDDEVRMGIFKAEDIGVLDMDEASEYIYDKGKGFEWLNPHNKECRV